MIIFKNTSDISAFLLSKKNAGTTIGFVPTMGALHGGHMELITTARKDNQLVVCSVFVNPTQFNDPRDFEKYPTTIEKDISLLEKAGCDILFLPSVDEIYPGGIKPVEVYELGFLETTLEGKFRPGHFQGVCQVVNRLLNIVKPGKLYLGQKDFQQCMVLKKLVKLEKIETEIIICPTLRATDGLAMSSRNLRLNDAERKKATGIFEALLSIKKDIREDNVAALRERAVQFLTKNGFKVDYLEIADAATLEIISGWDGKTPLVILAAAWLNEVRLIDNILL